MEEDLKKLGICFDLLALRFSTSSMVGIFNAFDLELPLFEGSEDILWKKKEDRASKAYCAMNIVGLEER